MTCFGNEESLDQCDLLSNSSCTHAQDVAITCRPLSGKYWDAVHVYSVHLLCLCVCVTVNIAGILHVNSTIAVYHTCTCMSEFRTEGFSVGQGKMCNTQSHAPWTGWESAFLRSLSSQRLLLVPKGLLKTITVTESLG